MSKEERDNELGKMVRERSEAKGESALLLNRIHSAMRHLSNASGLLAKDDRDAFKNAIGIVDQVTQSGGTQQLSKDIAEYLSLQVLIDEFNKSIRSAGIEL